MKRRRHTMCGWTLAVLALLLLSAGPGQAGDLREANAGMGGERLDIKPLVVKGQTTIVDFHSPYCPPCVKLAPLLAQLTQKRADINVRKVNINRPEVQGIDWNSPLAQQYSLRSVPYFVIFDGKGKLVAEGQEATRRIVDWLKEARILEE